MFLTLWKIVRALGELAPLAIDLLRVLTEKDEQATKEFLVLQAIEAKRLPEKKKRGG